MKDRVSGAPGQYKATVTAEEFAKLQNGQAFTITMVRDDRPEVEGTPYSKAAVLPDSVAAMICPNIEDPSPADAFAGLLPKRGGAMTGVISMGGYKITGLGAPTADTDASTKEYVDDRTLVATDPNNDGNIVLRYGSSVVGGGGGGGSSSGGLTAEEVQAMIDTALGGIENGTY